MELARLDGGHSGDWVQRGLQGPNAPPFAHHFFANTGALSRGMDFLPNLVIERRRDGQGKGSAPPG